jgi:beta-galactosidase
MADRRTDVLFGQDTQRTLCIPAPLLHEGENELIVFELHGADRHTVEFRDRADLG